MKKQNNFEAAISLILFVGLFVLVFSAPTPVPVAQAQQTQPYFTQSGVQTNLLTCGTSVTFNVPNQTQVWLTQLKSYPGANNQQTFNGPFTVPDTYTPDCTRDLGTFQNSVYTLVNGQKGNFLGTVEATVATGGPPTQSLVSVRISDQALRTCFDHLAAVGGVLQSTDPALSPGEWLVNVENTQPAFRNNPITSTNVSRSTLDQIVTALNSAPFAGGPKYFFDHTACIGFRSDGVAYGPQGYTTNWTGGSLNANGCPSWWTGSDQCSAFNPPIVPPPGLNPPSNGGNGGNNSGNGTLAPSDQAVLHGVFDDVLKRLQNILHIPESTSNLGDLLNNPNAILTPPPDNFSNSAGTFCHTFTTTLSSGMSGTEVAALQQALILEGFSISQDEQNNSQFGPTTQAAVKAFQLKYKAQILAKAGVSNPTGTFGSFSISEMNLLYGCQNNSGNQNNNLGSNDQSVLQNPGSGSPPPTDQNLATPPVNNPSDQTQNQSFFQQVTDFISNVFKSLFKGLGIRSQ